VRCTCTCPTPPGKHQLILAGDSTTGVEVVDGASEACHGMTPPTRCVAGLDADNVEKTHIARKVLRE